MSYISKRKYVIFAVIFVVLFFLLGYFIGLRKIPSIERVTTVINKDNPSDIKTDFEPFWKVWNIINEKYPGADKVTDQEKMEGAISGLMGSLNDPYSIYFNKEETKIFEDDVAGSFGGIGVEVGKKDKILTVIAPLKDTPGYKAGIKSGDKILKIDKTETSDLTIEDAIKLIRGEKGTEVVLTIYREGEKEPREIKIIRDIINVPTLDTELRNDRIFVIKLYSFSANSASLFKDAIKKFYDSKSDKLLIDLRGNPGGYLNASISMASWFLSEGKPVVIENYGKNEKEKIYRSKGYDIFNDNLKLVILIDGGSASASEILAGALHDYGLAKLVGTKSYGKGSVQEVVDVTSDTVLKITIAKWLTPKGISISETGLKPDYEVKITSKDVDEKKDPQMDKAIELLNNWSPIDKTTALK